MTGDLFGASAQLAITDDPAKTRALSQWHTPRKLAHRVVRDLVGGWARGRHIVEPSAGGGVFVDELLEVIGEFGRVTAVELDPAWAARLRARYAHEPRVTVVEADYLTTRIECDLVAGNPPYEDGLDTAFMAHALDTAGRFAFVVQTRAMHCQDRYARVWSRAARRNLAFCVRRPSFGGGSAKGDFCAVKASLMGSDEPNIHPTIEDWADDWSEL